MNKEYEFGSVYVDMINPLHNLINMILEDYERYTPSQLIIHIYGVSGNASASWSKPKL